MPYYDFSVTSPQRKQAQSGFTGSIENYTISTYHFERIPKSLNVNLHLKVYYLK